MMQTLLPYRSTRGGYLAALPVLLAVVLAFSAIGFAQVAPSSSSPAAQSAEQTSSDKGGSRAAAARKAKAQTRTHARKVLSYEDMELQAGPLPRLKMDGAENPDDVSA